MHVPVMTRSTIEALVWACGLLLQLVLLSVLFLRGIVRRAPLFTGLIGFYVLRSAVLYLGFSVVGAAAYRGMYEASQMIEIAGELGLAAVLALAIVQGDTDLVMQPHRRARVRSSVVLVVLVVAAVLLTWLLAGLVPASAAVRPDRAQLLFALLMILLWGGSRFLHSALEPARTILAGFALYGAASVAASLGRAHASLLHSTVEYAAWSYILSGAYLAAVIFWIIRFLSTGAGSIELASDSIQLTGDVS